MKDIQAPGRIYSLDALRSVMMMLGIVLHAGITYGIGDYAAFWPIKDKDNSIFFDLAVAIIHHFRMPVFFVTAGYFGALLFYKKGPRSMLVNRFKRILLPFLSGVMLLYPLAFFAFTYSSAAIKDLPLPLQYAWQEVVAGEFLPFNVLHLWFLYFLVLYSFGGWFIAMVFKRDTAFTRGVRKVCSEILRKPWLRIISLAALYSCCLWWIGAPYLVTNNSWAIEPPIFITYFLFFETGWIIFRTGSLQLLKDHPVIQLVAATLLFFVLIFIPWPETNAWLYVRELLSALLCSLYIFGFIALFITKFNASSKRFSYIMNASYWVYLVHLPVVAFIPGVLSGSGLPAFFKFAICLLVTAAICFTSYHYAVRNTVIGKFLNGKKNSQ
ncbi:MAG: acyltransferase family protein [Ferruginibacter sp.]